MSKTVIIDGQEYAHVTSVRVSHSVENLVSTATIELPSTCYKKKLKSSQRVSKGQSVSIYLGYDDANVLEFEGYVAKVSEKGGGIEVECEDVMFFFRQTAMDNKELGNPSVKDVLLEVIAKVNATGVLDGPLSLDCGLNYKYDKFVFQNASAFDVLKKVQDETHACIYIDDWGQLCVRPRYIDVNGSDVRYSFQRNICKDGLSLTWRDSRTTKLLVEVQGKGKVETTGKDGKKTVLKQTTVVVSAGEVGGDKITEKITGITDKKTLQSIAEDMYRHKNYTGFEGSFGTWLRPVAHAGDFAILRDEEDPSRDGKYYITSVDTVFSSAGGKRTIKLGHKV